MAEYAPHPIKEIHGSALPLLEQHLANYRGGKKKSVSWHFTLEKTKKNNNKKK